MQTRLLCQRHEQQTTDSDPAATGHIDGAQALAEGLDAYLSEIDGYATICGRHNSTAAIHNVGKALQVYRMFNTDPLTVQHLKHATDALPSWNEAVFWDSDGDKWEKLERDITARMKHHTKQHPIATRGVSFGGLPILIHAYKFEPDTAMKIELVVAQHTNPVPELSLHVVAAVLQCHEHLVPEYIASPLPPYQHHDAKFLTIHEYLSRTMPEQLYATQCLLRVSCHASNGVGSRDTLRGHHGALASHSIHAQETART